ncbi:MAG: HPF/RaiA family ribosome-associated protein [Gammaproteobacteria bacterium]|nr:HPF/RaiA family ribosome-associated protein [Gammaproteobacteria bacterium]
MNITIRTKGIEISCTIDQFVHDQVRTALQHLDEEIIAVDVFMKDANGPKGGIDKQALVRVQLRNQQVVAIETVHQNLHAAVRKSAKRIKRTVRRHLRKSQRFSKQRMHSQLGDPGIAAG